MKRYSLFNYMYVLFFLLCAALLFFGRHYYFAPIAQKVRHPLHPILRQSGGLGHLMGILGTLFMLLLLLYSIRKRFAFARKWGSLGTWLKIHIYLGIAGPGLVVFHTAFKLSGIVAVSFWSMVLVVVSGVVGKYIYELIPRSLSGMEMNRIELEAEEIGLTFEMRKLIPATHPFWKDMAHFEDNNPKPSTTNTLLLFLEPIRIRHRVSKLFESLKDIDHKTRRALHSLVVKRHMIIRKANVLQKAIKIIHYWHLVHKPFVIIMFLILIIHIYISASMGYLWIF